MKKTIAFEKDITFKTKIDEITSISLDNDLTLKGENSIVGNFYITGTYKMLSTSTMEEEYSYKIPCEIAISDEYDTYDSNIDIDDFTYEIINDEILRVNIEVVINNLERKEEIEENIFNEEERKEEIKNLIEEINNNELKEEIEEDRPSFIEVKEKMKEEKDNYLTYSVYIYKDGDTIDKILEKYNITKTELEDYNDLEDLKVGSKLVIPSYND